MAIITRAVEHEHEGLRLDGLLVRDESRPTPQPGVLVFHGWEGRSAAQEEVARSLAEWGYTGVAVDLYGDGRRGTTPEQCQALMTPLFEDRALLRRRLLRVVEVVGGLPEVDPARLAAIGFCFGGLCVLDLARAGAPVQGVASFHGLFTPAGLPTVNPIRPKIIAFHGWDDPMVPPADVVALGQELTAAGADWQLHAYGGTMHAFMAKFANSPERGLLYHPRSARRAWESLRGFLAETFGEQGRVSEG
jgi:dienelactone hydrolase